MARCGELDIRGGGREAIILGLQLHKLSTMQVFYYLLTPWVIRQPGTSPASPDCHNFLYITLHTVIAE